MDEKTRLRYLKIYKPAYDEFMKVYPFSPRTLNGELWADIPNYNDYQISSYARVKSFKKNIVKILKPSITTHGYLTINLCQNNNVKKFLIHRLVAHAFITNPLSKSQVNHINGDKLNSCTSNLEWATYEENMRHAWMLGFIDILKGLEHPMAKLTAEQILYIRANPDNLSLEDLATKFFVTDGTISDVQLGKRYKQVGGETRTSKVKRIPDDIRCKIRAEYKPWTHGCSTYALSKKYNVCPATVWKIINEAN